MGPLEEMKPWNTRGVEGVFRFLSRVWRLFVTEDGSLEASIKDVEPQEAFERLFHQSVQKVGEDIEALRFNTAISQLMIVINEAYKLDEKPRRLMEQFVLLLAPFAPHLSEELWQRLGHANSLAYEPWPSFDPGKTAEQFVEIILQVNGKVRSKIQVGTDTGEDELERIAFEDSNIRRHIDGKTVAKKIIVRNKLVNLVVR